MGGRWTEILGEGLDDRERELVAAAAGLVPLLAGNAARADAERRIPEENLTGLREAGLLRATVPQEFGGYGVGLRALVAVCAELGRGCASTAWVTSLYGGGAWLTAQLGDTVREQVWGGSPDVPACGAIGVPQPARHAAVLIEDALLRTAWIAGELDRAAAAGVILPELAGVRIRVDIAAAARSIRRAADMLLDVSGASRFAMKDPAQRMWRDLGTATRHPAFVTEVNRERYGQLLVSGGG